MLCRTLSQRSGVDDQCWLVPMPFARAEVDLRRAKRYPMSAAVSFCWDPGDGVLREGQGTTLDISSSGVFVITDLALPLGGRLELEIYLRPTGRDSKFVRFHGEGKVVRAAQKGSESGFAAEVLFQPEGSDSALSEQETAKLWRK
jgi:hypothetical protein